MTARLTSWTFAVMTMTRDHRAPVTRREVLTGLALGSAALLSGCSSSRGAGSPPTLPSVPAGGRALAGAHHLTPLPFAPSSLHGISERMIRSHHENNYGGAVRNLNRVERELAATTPETPPFVVAALRERELTFRNSKTLHEAYFGNLGGDGRRSGPIEAALADAYGSTARWEQHLRTTGLGLGGGSGWALLVFELDTGALRTISSGNHSQVLATSLPLLVMDLYEHSYHMDFGANVGRYVDAFFANVNWDEVNHRLERAERMSALLRPPR